MEKNVLNSIVGKTIEEIRVMSFYKNLDLVCDVIVLYIKVDTEVWYKFTTSDGLNTVELLNEEPVKIMLEEFEDEFAYPIKTVDLNCNNKKLKEIKEYMYESQNDELNGFYIELNDGSGFSLFEEEDCLKISDGIRIKDGYSLI